MPFRESCHMPFRKLIPHFTLTAVFGGKQIILHSCRSLAIDHWMRAYNTNTGRGQHFQGRAHSFSRYGPTQSRQITYIYIFQGLPMA